MRDSEWNSASFTELLRKLTEPPARLSPQDIRKMAGISKPQVYRWLQGENRPQPDALRSLGEALERDVPHAQVTSADLMQAAGYGPTVRISQMWVEYDAPGGTLDPAAAHRQDRFHEHEHDLDWWKADARYHDDADPGEWDLDDELERGVFMMRAVTWRAKRMILDIQRAERAAAEADRSLGDATEATGEPNGAPGV